MPFIKDGICYIPLQKSNRHKRWFALVDPDEYPRVSRVKWYGTRGGSTIYVRATSDRFVPKHHMSLHAYIMRVSPGQIVDHINGNGLDNRKSNLRIVSAAENAQNRFKTSSLHPTSRFKGVRKMQSGKWASSINFSGDLRVIGLFDDEVDAARAYDAEAVKLFGEFAKTNEDMGLFDGDEPQRSVEGQRLFPGKADFGVYHHPEQVLKDISPEGWAHSPSFDPDRRPSIETVVGMTRHRRSKRLMYRLSSGRVVHIDDYLGTPPSPEDRDRMVAELEDRERRKRFNKRQS